MSESMVEVSWIFLVKNCGIRDTKKTTYKRNWKQYLRKNGVFRAVIILKVCTKSIGYAYMIGQNRPKGRESTDCEGHLKKFKKHKAYLMTWLAMSLYQQIVKVVLILDFNGAGIFIQKFYILGNLSKIPSQMSKINGDQNFL